MHWMSAGMRRLAALVAAAALAACSDGIVDVDPPPSFAFLLTEPQAAPVSTGLLAASPRINEGVIYVSVPPASLVGGRSAALRNLSNGFAATAALENGGFDPVLMVAGVGDSIEVVVTDGSGVAIGRAVLAVPVRRPPIVVRTVPPKGGTDVPLNAVLRFVFSEPMDPRTITTGNVRLMLGSVPVAGRVNLSADGLRADFLPDSLLARASAYTLVVMVTVADLSGDALGERVTVDFTTADRATASPVGSVTVSPSSATVPVQGAVTLVATPRDAGGNAIASEPIAWSSNATVVTVAAWSDSSGVDDRRGVVRGVRPGSAVVTATAAGVSGSAVITVPSDAGVTVASVAIKTDGRCERVLAKGDLCMLNAVVTDASGNIIRRDVAWSSSDPAVAPVTPYAFVTGGVTYTGGFIVGRAEGTVVVTATSGGVSGTLTVTIVPPRRVASLVMAPASRAILVGEEVSLWAEAADADGVQISTLGRPFTWRSSNPAIAWVDTTQTGSGLYQALRGVAPGSATVTATVDGVSASAIVTVQYLPPFSSLSAGDDRAAGSLSIWTVAGNTCGLTVQGEVYCWGSSDYGQDADYWHGFNGIPQRQPGNVRFSSITTGAVHSCGLTAAGEAWCWGLGWTDAFATLPVAVPTGLRFVSLDIGINNDQTCGLTAAGAGYCFSGTASLPAPVPGGHVYQSLQVGNNHYCGLTTAGAAYCWGANNFGQLGDSTTADRTAPVAVRGGHVFVALVSGKMHSCGLTATGAVWCWGSGGDGQLGDGAFEARSFPVQVSGGISFASLSAESGADVTCGLAVGGTAYCWGYNNEGQLGDGSTVNRSIPTAVVGGLLFSSISTSDHTCAITTAAVAYCWGVNTTGQLGDGWNAYNSSVPMKVIGQP